MSEGIQRGLWPRLTETTDDNFGQTDAGPANDKVGNKSGTPAKSANALPAPEDRPFMQNSIEISPEDGTNQLIAGSSSQPEYSSTKEPYTFEQFFRDYKSYVSTKYNKLYLITGMSMIILMSLFLYAVMSHNLSLIFVVGLPMFLFCIILVFLLERAKPNENET
jgi:hypothetical protein